jgi:signal transduction histidine kinase
LKQLNRSKENNQIKLIIFVALVLLGTTISSIWQVLHINNSHVPAVKISKDIKYHVSIFHLWLEEYIAGDKDLEKSDIWKHLAEARALSKQLLAVGEYNDKTTYLLGNHEVQIKIRAVLKELDVLDELARIRADKLTISQAGSITDIQFDKHFEIIQTMLVTTESLMDSFIDNELRRFLFLNVASVLLITIFALILVRTFIIKDRERKEAAAQVIQASKLATLGEMSTSVAHELNQPLNVIRLAAGNSRRRISKGNADIQYLNDKLERIESQTVRATAIIDHMRMFGRKAHEKPELIDPRRVVTNTLELMGEQLRLDGIEIVTELAQECGSTLGHAIQMEQVVLNLLTNARDAMVDSDREKKITLRVFEDAKGVQITSVDSGGGIPDDVLPRIFDPFYTTKNIGKGTGLGLSVSYGIIREMDGTIVAENIDGGARFTITLPSVS